MIEMTKKQDDKMDEGQGGGIGNRVEGWRGGGGVEGWGRWLEE